MMTQSMEQSVLWASGGVAGEAGEEEQSAGVMGLHPVQAEGDPHPRVIQTDSGSMTCLRRTRPQYAVVHLQDVQHQVQLQQVLEALTCE
jgi:hypothetical protein